VRRPRVRVLGLGFWGLGVVVRGGLEVRSFWVAGVTRIAWFVAGVACCAPEGHFDGLWFGLGRRAGVPFLCTAVGRALGCLLWDGVFFIVVKPSQNGGPHSLLRLGKGRTFEE